ncbi:MAG: putative zinc-binding protein [Thermacetogeniaceae bacterium]
MLEEIVPEKIGVISCSGEDCLGGTISRLATRKMLEQLRPGQTVTICLPLFLAGGEEERMFAATFPTITVDGCDKLCAKRATEKYSGKVSAAIVVSDIIGKDVAESGILTTDQLTEEHLEMVDRVAAAIEKEFDKIIGPGKDGGGCGCCCGR